MEIAQLVEGNRFLSRNRYVWRVLDLSAVATHSDDHGFLTYMGPAFCLDYRWDLHDGIDLDDSLLSFGIRDLDVLDDDRTRHVALFDSRVDHFGGA